MASAAAPPARPTHQPGIGTATGSAFHARPRAAATPSDDTLLGSDAVHNSSTAASTQRLHEAAEHVAATAALVYAAVNALVHAVQAAAPGTPVPSATAFFDDPDRDPMLDLDIEV